MSTGKVKLWSNPACPFAHRAWIAAIEKEIDFEFKLIPLSGEIAKIEKTKKEPKEIAEEFPAFSIWVDQKKTSQEIVQLKEWYKQNVNPTGEVPTVEVDGKFVPESEICAEFLDTLFPNKGTRLVPADPYKAAKIRLAIKGFSNFTTASYGLLMNQESEKDAEFGEKISSELTKFFRHFVPVEEGPYFLGKDFSLADVVAAPFFDRFRYILSHYRGFHVLPSADHDKEYPWAPRARAWFAAVEQRKSFKETTQNSAWVIAAYEPYANKQIWKDGKWDGRGVSNTFGK